MAKSIVYQGITLLQCNSTMCKCSVCVSPQVQCAAGTVRSSGICTEFACHPALDHSYKIQHRT